MADLEIIDPHHHLYNLANSYPWLERSVPPFRYHGDDRPIRRNYLVGDYLSDFAGLNLIGSVHIENGAADPIAEARWVDHLTFEGTIPSAQVARVDLLATNARDNLAQLARLSSVRGIRHILNWHPDPAWTHTDRADIITDPVFRHHFAMLAEYDFSFDLQVFSPQLPQAAELAGAYPTIRIVLDHAGMPVDRSLDTLRDWRAGMQLLARQPNVVVKISGIGTTDHDWTIESIKPIVLDTIEIFGPQRCMFASNFPVDRLYSTAQRLYDAFDTLTADFSAAERQALFAGTAAITYRLPYGPGSRGGSLN
ncbi:MAG: amidohydrolase family protein [Acidothermus cellulolyticus]|nr:amidohydrolase family protein [Acidothermus cellulolyticus]